MSRATLYVRFADGTVRYGLYDGTIDQPCGPLYDSPAQAWDRYDLGADPTGEGEAVDMATDYGSGSHWRGTATRDQVTSIIDDFEDCQDGLPDWAKYPRVGSGETPA